MWWGVGLGGGTRGPQKNADSYFFLSVFFFFFFFYFILLGFYTWDYLINHRLCPYQCAPNLFRVLGSVDALNEQMNLGLTWHDVVHMY